MVRTATALPTRRPARQANVPSSASDPIPAQHGDQPLPGVTHADHPLHGRVDQWIQRRLLLREARLDDVAEGPVVGAHLAELVDVIRLVLDGDQQDRGADEDGDERQDLAEVPGPAGAAPRFGHRIGGIRHTFR